MFGDNNIALTFKFHQKVQKLDYKDVSTSLFPKCQHATHISSNLAPQTPLIEKVARRSVCSLVIC